MGIAYTVEREYKVGLVSIGSVRVGEEQGRLIVVGPMPTAY